MQINDRTITNLQLWISLPLRQTNQSTTLTALVWPAACQCEKWWNKLQELDKTMLE